MAAGVVCPRCPCRSGYTSAVLATAPAHTRTHASWRWRSFAGGLLRLDLGSLAVLLPERALANVLVHRENDADANLLREAAKEADDVVEHRVRGVRRRVVGTALGATLEADGREGRLDKGRSGGDGDGRLADLGHVGDNKRGEDHAEEHALRLDLGGDGRVPRLQAALGARVRSEECRGDAAGQRANVEDERLGRVGLVGARDELRENGAGELEGPRDVLRVSSRSLCSNSQSGQWRQSPQGQSRRTRRASRATCRRC